MKHLYLLSMIIVSLLITGCVGKQPIVTQTNNKINLKAKPKFLIKKGISQKILINNYNKSNLAYIINVINNKFIIIKDDAIAEALLKINSFQYDIKELENRKFKHDVYVETEIIIKNDDESNSFKSTYEMNRIVDVNKKQKQYISDTIQNSFEKSLNNLLKKNRRINE